jgi:competence protein ComEC
VGSLCLHHRDFTAKKNHIVHQRIHFEHYLAQVIDAVDSSGRYDKLVVKIRQIRLDTSWVKAEGKVLLYISESGNINYGDILLVKGLPNRIRSPLNPDEFDYQKYMRNKGILFQHFLKPDDFLIVDQIPGSFIYRVSTNARQGIISIISNSFNEESTRGIMLALLAGQRHYIDHETYDRFIDIGIIHVLAVSGLHVGIIYMFLLALLRPLHKNKWGKRFSLCIKIIVLLFFAFLTGLSPSVLRATLMFSIMIVGKILNRNSHILNSVFLSACILLNINPYLLFDVGFQLSYSAVIGIIMFQPVIYGDLNCKVKVINWIWQLTAVSIAAQLGTFPISLFYFKQFPTYFLLGNIFAIPYVTMSITMGIVFLFVFPIKQIAIIIVWFLQILTKIFLTVISMIQMLPFGKIYPINVNTDQSILLYGLILSVYIMLKKRNWKIIFISLITVTGIIIIDIRQYIDLQSESKIIVYHIPDQSCIELVDRRNGIMLVNDLSEDLKSKINYHTTNHILKERRKTEIYDFTNFSAKFSSYVEDGILLFAWNGNSIAIIHDKCFIESLGSIPIDYLIVTGNNLNVNDYLNKNLNVEQVIWDSSNSIHQTDYYQLQNNTSMHHVRVNGPYINRLKD